MSVILAENIFTVSQSDYTVEQWERLKKLEASERRAELQLSQIYGKRAAAVIVFNIMVSYKNAYRKFADTYDQACEGLGDIAVNDIIFRAVNHLPAKGVEQRQKREGAV